MLRVFPLAIHCEASLPPFLAYTAVGATVIVVISVALVECCRLPEECRYVWLAQQFFLSMHVCHDLYIPQSGVVPVAAVVPLFQALAYTGATEGPYVAGMRVTAESSHEIGQTCERQPQILKDGDIGEETLSSPPWAKAGAPVR